MKIPRLLAAALALGLLTPAGSLSQVLDLDASVQRSFSSIGVLESPMGFRVGVTGDHLLGPMGLQLSYDRVRETSVDEDGFCPALLPCVAGPLDQSASLSALRLSLRVGTTPDRPVQATLAVSGIHASFHESLTRSGTDDRVDGSNADAYGFGLSGELRLPEVVAGIRPLVFGQVERIGSQPCPQDAACFFSETRTVRAVGAGLALRFR